MTDGPHNDVLWGYLHPNEIAASTHQSILDLVGYDLSGPRRLKTWVRVKCGSMGIPEGRNDLTKEFLKGDSQWLFMTDSDMGFAPDTLDALLSVADATERPIIGGLAFAQRESVPDGLNGFRCFPRPTILDWIEHEDGISRFTGRAHYPVNTLTRCGATGCAMLLIHRSVIEAIAEKHGEVWFDQLNDATGMKMGEDVSFFVRTQSLKFPLFVHTGIRTNHLKSLWLGEDDFWTSFIAPPATEEVDVIVPVLHRPQNIEPLMTSLRASTGLATAWFVTEMGDREEVEEIVRCGGCAISHVDAHTFSEKVNHAYRVTGGGDPATRHKPPRPWLLLVGDDVRFRPGWLDHAQDVHRRYGANVVGTNDLCNPRVTRGEHSTHSMIRRSYVDEVGSSWDGPGTVCHEGYRHWFVDDEIVVAAKQRGTFQSALGSQVEHLHPIAGKAEEDDVYRLGAESADADEALFDQRFTAAMA